MLQRKNYAALGQITAPYVHAVSHNGTLYVSGLTAHGTSAGQHDIAAQAEAIFDQLEVITLAEQTSLQNLIKVTIFITSFVDIDSLRKVLFKRYGSDLPASSLVQVSALFAPELLIEIEAVIAL